MGLLPGIIDLLATEARSSIPIRLNFLKRLVMQATQQMLKDKLVYEALLHTIVLQHSRGFVDYLLSGT